MHHPYVARKIWPFLSLIQHDPTCCKIPQQDGKTYATSCAQQYCKMLRWNAASVLPGLKKYHYNLIYLWSTVYIIYNGNWTEFNLSESIERANHFHWLFCYIKQLFTEHYFYVYGHANKACCLSNSFSLSLFYQIDVKSEVLKRVSMVNTFNF